MPGRWAECVSMLCSGLASMQGAVVPGPVLPRRMANVLVPLPGEAMASWMSRAALDLDLLLPQLWTVLGLSEGREYPPGVGVAMSGEQKAATSAATGLSEPAVESMLVRSLPGMAFQFPDGPDVALTVGQVRRSWVYMLGSHACPECLRENEGWLVGWRVPFSFACARHGRYLAATCPACGHRLMQQSFSPEGVRACVSRGGDVGEQRPPDRRRSGVSVRRCLSRHGAPPTSLGPPTPPCVGPLVAAV